MSCACVHFIYKQPLVFSRCPCIVLFNSHFCLELIPLKFTCSSDVVLNGITSGKELQSSDRKVFTSITVKRRAAIRQAAPALSQVVEHCPPLDVVVWNPGADRAK